MRLASNVVWSMSTQRFSGQTRHSVQRKHCATDVDDVIFYVKAGDWRLMALGPTSARRPGVTIYTRFDHDHSAGTVQVFQKYDSLMMYFYRYSITNKAQHLYNLGLHVIHFHRTSQLDRLVLIGLWLLLSHLRFSPSAWLCAHCKCNYWIVFLNRGSMSK